MPEFRHLRSGSLNIPAAPAGHGAAHLMGRSPPSASYRLASVPVPGPGDSTMRDSPQHQHQHQHQPQPQHTQPHPQHQHQHQHHQQHLNQSHHRHNLVFLRRQSPVNTADLHHIKHRRHNSRDNPRHDPADRRAVTDTSHVPCKFFRQGTCQAGNACPFSHDIGTSAETVCKYFAKGNCKFGPKCANVHVLPDGRRINYGKNGVTIGTSPINLMSRASPGSASPTSGPATAYSQGVSASALTSSLYQYPSDDRHGPHRGHDSTVPAIDMPYPHSSNYDSPRDDDAVRLAFGRSPVNAKGLSVLDAPLPSSFDSNGISNAARFPSAPWPSSVPSKFGLDSPALSLGSVRDSPRASETLKLLHTSAFGSSDHLGSSAAGSPPNSQPLLQGDEYYGKRAMHSSRYAKPRMLSASLPKAANVDRDWEAGFAFDEGDNVPENYVPENLQDLLTPAEKARRGSMRAESDSPFDGMARYGSPGLGSSPSRWGPYFQRQREDEDSGRVARSALSAFGHVGSPLRKSTLAQEMGSGPKGHSAIAGAANSSRPSAQRVSSEGMSVLSQQLQRTRLDENAGASSPLLHPTAARISAGGVGPIGRDRAMERHVSTGSIGSSMAGRFTTPIDEEAPDFVFSMEDEDASSTRTRKLPAGGLGSYPGNVSGAPSANNAPQDARDAMSVPGR